MAADSNTRPESALQGWQSIETAPKGETILGLKAGRGEASAPVICGELYDPRLAGAPAIIDRWSGRWATVTHWLPLPPLPLSTRGEAR